jgi:hypothetical protein
MTTDPIDTMEMARSELAREMYPSPEDMIPELSPLAALFFTEQCAVELLKHYITSLEGEDQDALDTSEGIGKALEAIAQALGMLDAACVAMGILPDEAIA